MAFTTVLTADEQISVGSAVIRLHSDSSSKKVRLQIDAPRDVIIVKEPKTHA